MMSRSASDGFWTFSSATHEAQLYWANRSSPPGSVARSLRTSACFMRVLTRSAVTTVQQDDVWNMDEHGIGFGVCNSQVIGASGKRKTYIQSPENRGWAPTPVPQVDLYARLWPLRAKVFRPHGLPRATSPTG